MRRIGQQRKSIFLLVLIVTILVTLPSLCYASNWVYVCSSKAGTKFYLDTESIESGGSYMRYWINLVYPAVDKYGDKQASQYIEIHFVNPPQFRILKIKSYDENNNVNRNVDDRPSDWTEMSRGGIMWSMTNAAGYYLNH